MENEKNEQKNEQKTPKGSGVYANVSLTPGSETHKRFVRLMEETGTTSPKGMVDILMDSYETPHTDNSEVIANLNLEIEDLKSQNEAYDTTCKNYETEIADLKNKLEAANNTANENAVRAQSIEMAHQGAIVIKPNPVVAYFLNEMAAQTNKTPAEILQALYIDDLQNPRANNLPYTVTASRIREVMEELKKQAEQ